jgi:penicillin-binding protein 2
MKNPFEIYTSLNSSKRSRPLDWEESAVDSESDLEEVHDEERSDAKTFGPWLLLVATFAILISRVFYLQIIHGSSFRALADNNRVRSQTILAPRGLITDQYGQVLAQNTASFNLVAVPFDLPKSQTDLTAEINKVAENFGFEPNEVLKKIKSAGFNSLVPIIAKQQLNQDQAILFETRASEFVGLSIQQVPVREYLDALAFSNVLGYSGLVSPGDLTDQNKKLYDAVDFIGKTGIEYSYEKYLHGSNGQNIIEVDATGKFLNALGQDSPTPGRKLVLNLDKGLQDELFKRLSTIKSPKAAAVAMDPKTGAILALVSLPGFDNNVFSGGISQQDYQNLLTDPSLPLFNRAVSGTYPPGSTSKVMTATAGLQEGVIDPNTIIVDNGNLVVPNQYNPSQKYEFHGWKPGGLGKMNVYSAIAMSSDIYFYEVAGGSPNGSVVGLGADRLAEYYRKFGLGKILGIDIPGERTGLVPDPAWKMKYYKNDPLQGKWYLGDTYHLGIGQGDLLVTPLQVAEWTSIVANGGTGYVPQIAKKVEDQSGKTIWQSQPKILVSDIASPEVFKTVQQGMRQTVLAGTAKPLQSLPITSAGKTGTSQFDGANPERTHAWFTAYAPYENPQIVITVLVEAGGEGNAVAEPVVKDALDWWAKNRMGK